MEQGNEGDEIIILAFRQISCNLGPEIVKVSQISQENLIQIVSKSLSLISQGEIQLPEVLPPNVASRHRICTSMAAKIKENGFSGEMGYNQLLYPVEAQTRSLLSWLVQKLPRSEEDQAEEVLGANALRNKIILQSLTQWKKQAWVVSKSAHGVPLTNIYRSRTFSTVTNRGGAHELYRECRARSYGPEHSFFERHAAQLIKDSEYASLLEQNLDGGDDMEGSVSKYNKKLSERLNATVRQAISTAKQASAMGNASGGNELGNSMSSGDANTSGLDGLDISDEKHFKMMEQSFQDVIKSMVDEHEDSASGHKMERGTRFAHASEFSQEAAASIGQLGSASALQNAMVARRAGLLAEDAASRQAMLEMDEKAREDELESLRSEIGDKTTLVEKLDRHLENATSKIRQLESELSELLSQGEALEKDILIKKKTLEMLPSAADNISKLQAICGASAMRLMQLAQEWETHRQPLIAQFRALKQARATRRDKCKQKVDEMKKIREEMVSMVQDLKDKQERSQVLNDELKKLPKNINRNLYVQRIMDIISSINKQNKEIDRITSDVRDLQKTINSNNNTLARADALTEERVYSAANNANSDPSIVDVYRRLRSLRANFEDLISTVGKIGAQEKAARDLETKIDQEENRVSANNSDRLRVDYEEVVKENATLVAQIKALSRK